jgi:hypothetical protein
MSLKPQEMEICSTNTLVTLFTEEHVVRDEGRILK